MAYLPLARKYRPQTFDELTGQSHVTTTLARAIETKRIGQAYLFAGQRGVGKTSAARILAKCLNCSKGPTAKPCQRCPICVQITNGSSLDVLEIDGASNRGIDEIRSLRETVKFAPTQGPYRIYIIDEVHMLTPEAFNALLKTLEEPPAHVKFIFATTAPNKVLPTILSRCQRFDFRRLDVKTIVAALQQIAKAERIAVEEPALYAIARAAEGSLRDAEVVLEQLVSFCEHRIGEEEVSQLLGATEQETLVAWAQTVLDRDPQSALRVLNEQLDRGKEPTQLLVDLLMHLRNLLVLRTGANAASKSTVLEQLVDIPKDQRARLEEQAAQSSLEELLVMAQLVTGAYELARRSPFAQVIVELTLIKLATRESWMSLEQLVQRLDAAASRVPASLPATPLAQAVPSPVASPSRAPMSIVPGNAVISLDVVTAQWPTVLERLGQQKMSLAAYLMEARPTGISGDRLQVGLPGFALHQEVVTLPESLRLVERTLQEVFAQKLTVEYGTLPAPSPSAPEVAVNQPAAQAMTPDRASPPPSPIIQDIVKLFDARIVDRSPSQPSSAGAA